MLTLLASRAAARVVSLAIPIWLAFGIGAAQPALTRYQSTCQPGHYDVVVPGYVGVPASVDVGCAGTITTMDVQWPFDDPSPEAWHNRYELNSADLSVSITVGGDWLCTLQWIPNDGGTTRYLIAGCPEIYGGDGMAVPWNDPCIQKVRNRIYPDFWIFKNVVAQNGSTSLKTLSRMLAGIEQGVGGREASDPNEDPPGSASPWIGLEPLDSGIPVDGTKPYPRGPHRTPPRTIDDEPAPGHTLTPPDSDILKQLDRRPTERP